MIISIKDNKFNCKVVATPKKIREGMMFKKFNGDFDGMLFFMERGPQSFWMKNCLVSLDMIFIDNGIIHNIQHHCKPCKTKDCPGYKGYGDMVLELPGGTCEKYDIKKGDEVKFN